MKEMNRDFLRCALLCVFTATAWVGCAKDPDTHDHPDLNSGEALFKYHCAKCHGEDGTGKLVESTPANILTRRDVPGIVRYVRGDAWQGRQMPVFAKMPLAEARKIAAYLVALRDRYHSLPVNRKKYRELMIDPQQVEKEHQSPEDIVNGNR